MKISGTNPAQSSPGSNVNAAVRMAMMVKAKDAQKAEGEAALKLIESSTTSAPRSDDTRGSRVDRYA